MGGGPERRALDRLAGGGGHRDGHAEGGGVERLAAACGGEQGHGTERAEDAAHGWSRIPKPAPTLTIEGCNPLPASTRSYIARSENPLMKPRSMPALRPKCDSSAESPEIWSRGAIHGFMENTGLGIVRASPTPRGISQWLLA